MRSILPASLCAGASACVLALTATAQPAPPKKPLTYADYARWRALRDAEISPDGAWVAYGLVPAEGDGDLIVRAVQGSAEYRYPRGSGAVFTHDSRFVLLLEAPAGAPPPATGAGAGPRPPGVPTPTPARAATLVVRELASGQSTRIERVRSFSRSPKAGTTVAVLADEAPPVPAPAGTTSASTPPRGASTHLLLLQPGGPAPARLDHVTAYRWSDDGASVAYVVDAEGTDKDGVYARRLADAATRTLLTGDAAFQRLTFSSDGTRLAFLSDLGTHREPVPTFRLYQAPAGAATATDALSGVAGSLPAGWAVSPNGALRFSPDGTRLFFGTAPVRAPRPKDAPPAYNVDLWHWKDGLIQPMQRVRAPLEASRSFLALVNLTAKRFVQLGTAETPNVTVTEDGSVALGTSELPYLQDLSWDGFYQDVAFVNPADGTRRPFLTRSGTGADLSPGGRYALTFEEKERAWYAYRVADGSRVNLTKKIPTHFEREEWDYPTPPAPYGAAGWTANDRTVVLYDQFDLWEVSPEGAAPPRCLTAHHGRKQRIAFRYQRLDPEERAIPSGSLLLAAVDDRTQATGYYRTSSEGGDPTRLVMLDRRFGGVQKARAADTLMFTLQAFDQAPDVWVSDGRFGDRRRLSDSNPQQREYRWGHSQLMNYRSTGGKKLQALVTRPEGFEVGRRYPVLVYIYEQRTQALHQYVTPNAGTSPNVIRYVSNGYVVLQPDIVFEPGRPGESSLACVVPAVRKLIEMGVADPERIGIAGHSWGGYQTAYLITRTNLFRAAESGAPVANMLSAYGGIRYDSGMVREFQYETGQSRIGGTPWNRRNAYLANSPLLGLDRVKTPLLILHNDQDGAVPWTQGIELFTGLRRLQKEAYFFSYGGEGHGLRSRDNQRHYTVHMDEFFDHLLLGAPRPQWMESGVPFSERGFRDVRPLFASPKP